MNNLQELIQAHKGKRSYANLAEASDGQVKAASLQALATATGTAFPSVNTLQGIATALNLHINDVVLAAGRSAGLDTHPMPDVHDLNERVFYHQHHAATHKAQLAALRARIINPQEL
ncbi:hypothetical protein [Paeniglutamicibacter antarcticus]|uniref:HTH cro/C1-type domain-containing protein n=1 Tax=Paeniglutamicibacter antarcticus TaxID=494023 RepID=A0ABP9TL38_9MICC